ncbi:MAG: hypothetical protein HYR95_01285 [Candidatus Colwellbacteria bacterium]|nr:hypothetical protein [Candidatus Colwellbacteria bacterium]
MAILKISSSLADESISEEMSVLAVISEATIISKRMATTLRRRIKSQNVLCPRP